ncbi:hypothetical protein AB4059_00600 [Lysobacter sp. 2RAF19]
MLISLDTLDEAAEVIVAAAYEFRGRNEAPFVDAWEVGMPSREIAERLAEQTAAATST